MQRDVWRMLPCETTTPLGLPVEPDVYCSSATALPSSGGRRHEAALPSAISRATRLEGMWNHLRRSEPFTLFCAYTLDVLSPSTKSRELQEIMAVHSHLLPTRSNGEPPSRGT